MNQFDARVKSVSEPIQGSRRVRGRSIENSFIITFECPQIANVAVPGQFVMVNCQQDGSILPRPFSINRSGNGEVTLYVAWLEGGKGTEWLFNRKPGDTVKLMGPLGNGFALEDTTNSALLVAGGMGIAPLLFLAQKLVETNVKTTVLYGTPEGDRFPFEKFVPQASTIIASEDGSEGYYGLVTDLIPEHIDSADQVFVCGPSGMYSYLKTNRISIFKDKPVQVSLETRMACGRGICYGCTIQTVHGLKRVCEHGPVFDIDEIIIE